MKQAYPFIAGAVVGILAGVLGLEFLSAKWWVFVVCMLIFRGVAK